MKKIILGVLALACTLTFSSCDDDENVVITNAGELTGGPFSFFKDGQVDNVSGIAITGTVQGSKTSFIITDADGEILGLPGDITALEGVNFDEPAPGTCFIWHIAYEDGLQGLAAGNNTSDLSPSVLFDLSNSIRVDRGEGPEAGMLTGGPFEFVEGDGVVDNVSGIAVTGNPVGSNSSFVITDENGKILGLPGDLAALEGVNFDGAGPGLCFIWYIRYEGEAADIGLVADANAGDLTGVFDLSNSIEVNRKESAALTLDVMGLENLGDDYKYEGWVIVNGAPVTTGVFTVDDAGVLSETEFKIAKSDLDAATAFVLSIEPAMDPDPAPADTKLLIGNFSGNSASVSSTGIVGDFTSSTGKYILATPTDMDATNEYSGIWFLDDTSMPATAGLDLPTLSPGWKYEGWVVIDGTPISTGTFLDPAAADDNASTSPYKGTVSDGPPFPGEDYVMGSVGSINFPIDLRGKTVVISVEPSPDNSPAPFTLKPLAQGIPAMAMDHTVLNIGAGPVKAIMGTVTR